MEPTEQEIQWAKAIKEAVEKDESLKPLTDFEYLQHAIVAKEKVEKALVRVKRMEEFRGTYCLEGDGNVEDGIGRLKKVIEKHPGMLLSIGKDNEGRTVWAGDFHKFYAKKLTTEEDWKDMMGGFYYLFQAMQPDTKSIRDGVVWVAHTKGVGWSNFSFELEKRAAQFYSHCYPFRIKEMAILDPPTIFKFFYNLIRVFMSKKVISVIKMMSTKKYLEMKQGVCGKDVLPPSMGGTFQEESLADAIESLLKQRFKNSATFKL